MVVICCFENVKASADKAVEWPETAVEAYRKFNPANIYYEKGQPRVISTKTPFASLSTLINHELFCTKIIITNMKCNGVITFNENIAFGFVKIAATDQEIMNKAKVTSRTITPLVFSNELLIAGDAYSEYLIDGNVQDFRDNSSNNLNLLINSFSPMRIEFRNVTGAWKFEGTKREDDVFLGWKDPNNDLVIYDFTK